VSAGLSMKGGFNFRILLEVETNHKNILFKFLIEHELAKLQDSTSIIIFKVDRI
jgi:hypothetical protein